MLPENHEYSVEVGGKTLTFETGRLASQAGGAVTLRVGDSMVFSAATMSDEPREGIDFFPLSVDYEERMYAGGRIPGSFFRREGRPHEDAILTARLTDRPLRPLFPKDMRNDVQVIMYSFSSDGINPLDILCINVASASLVVSDIPWAGPVAAVRVAYVDGEYVINPTFEELGNSTLDLRLAGTRDAILMVECGAYEVPEDVMIGALEIGHQSLQPIIDLQERMAADLGKAKRSYPPFVVSDELVEMVRGRAADRLEAILDEHNAKHELDQAVREFQTVLVNELATDEGPSSKDVVNALSTVYKQVVRRRILDKGVRPDGRNTEQIRNIWCDVDVSPRAHGSGLFTRGETQVMTLATLGTPRDAQELDNLTPIENKRYMHHYNFPPFSVGETRPLRGSSRREIGHGALAERAYCR
jgi:polyribonucleotide nucleotidyltransferase